MFRGSRVSSFVAAQALLAATVLFAPGASVLAAAYYNLAMFWKTGQVATPVVTAPAGDYSTNGNGMAISGNCSSPTVVYVDIYIGGVLDASATCTAGAFAALLTRSSDGTYVVTVKGRDLTGNRSDATTAFNWIRDIVPPHLDAFALNGSCVSTIASNMVPAVVTTDNEAAGALDKVRFSLNATFADSGWQVYNNPTTYVAPFVAGAAITRTVYAWVKDKAGNISSNSLDCQVTTNIGMPPDVRFINPVGGTNYDTGSTVHVDWNISSSPGLATNGVELDWTIDNGSSWTVVSSSYDGSSNSGCSIGTGATGCAEFSLPGALDDENFKLILRATDVNGAVGTVMSGTLNVDGLKLFAGNDASQFGSSAMSTSLDFYASYWTPQTIDSQGNIYMIAANCNVYKLDGTTNNISIFFGNGTCNNPDVDGQSRSWTLANGMPRSYSIAVDSQDNVYLDNTSRYRIIRWNKTTGDFENWVGGNMSPANNTTDWAPTTGMNKFVPAISAGGQMVFDSQDRLIFVHYAYGYPAVPGVPSYYDDSSYQSPYIVLRVNNDSTLEVLIGNYTTSSGPVDGDLGTDHGALHLWDGDTDPTYPAPGGSTSLGNPRPINYHTWNFWPSLGIRRGSPDILFFGTQGSDPVHASSDYQFSFWSYNTSTRRMTYLYTMGTYYPMTIHWDESRDRAVVDQHYYSGLANAFRLIDVSTADAPSITIDISSYFDEPIYGFAIDASGGIYFESNGNQQLFYMDPSNNAVSVYAGAAPNSGNGGDAKLANFRYPWSVVKDSGGNVYFHDQTNLEIRKIDSGGTISKERDLWGYFGRSHFEINPTDDHLIWGEDYANLGINSEPNGNTWGIYGGIFDVTSGAEACLFFCGDPSDLNWSTLNVYPTNLSANVPDGSNGRTDIWAGHTLGQLSGMAFDPVNNDFYFHRYEYYTDWVHWADTSTSPPLVADFSYTDIIGRIENGTNNFYRVVAGTDIASEGTSNYAAVPVEGAPTAGNSTGYYHYNSSSFDYPYTMGGPSHLMQVYNGIVYQATYNGKVYAFDTAPLGLVYRVSDDSVSDGTYNNGYIHSYLIDGINDKMYYIQDKKLYVKPIFGGDGSSTLLETLPSRMFLVSKSPNANSLLLVYRHQIYEYTNSSFID